jgi:hypothetical protein
MDELSIIAGEVLVLLTAGAGVGVAAVPDGWLSGIMPHDIAAIIAAAITTPARAITWTLSDLMHPYPFRMQKIRVR